MLAQKNRFHGHQAVRVTYRQGRMVRNDLGTLHFTRDENRRNYRMAVVIGKKTIAKAVARNRLRRRMFEIIRTHAQELSGVASLVFTVHAANTVKLKPAELRGQVQDLLAKAKLLKTNNP